MLPRNYLLHNRYRIIRPLGKGGFGQVYEALDDKLDCVVAIKERNAEHAAEKLRRAFEREAKLLANLRHPALPKVTDHFFEGEGQFLVMEFIEGDDLAKLLSKRRSPFGVEEVLVWADDLLKALEYLHTQDEPIIHRDIKPANIKLTDRDEIFLLDFGLAKGTAGSMPEYETGHRSSSVHGYTAAYAPLEQLNNSGTNEQSDIYSLGATIYHLLSGRVPVTAAQRYQGLEMGQADPLQPAHEVNPAIPLPVSLVLSQAMGMSRRDRLSSARQMREYLAHARRESEEIAQRANEKTVVVNEGWGTVGPQPDPLQQVGSQPAKDQSHRSQSAEASWPSQLQSEPSDSQWPSSVQDENLTLLMDNEEAKTPAEEGGEQLKLAEEYTRGDRRRDQSAIKESTVARRVTTKSRNTLQPSTLIMPALQLSGQRGQTGQNPLKSRGILIGLIAVLILGAAIVITFIPTRQSSNDNRAQSSTNRPSQGGVNNMPRSQPPPETPKNFSLKQTLDDFGSKVWSVSFSPDGTMAAAAGEGGKIRIWDTRSWGLKYTIEGPQAHTKDVNSISFSHDGHFIASGSSDHTVRLWNALDGLLIKTLSGHQEWVLSIAFSPDDSILASAGKDHNVYLWEVGTGHRVNELRSHTDEVWSVAFSPDGRTLASAGKDMRVILWDIPSMSKLREIKVNGIIFLNFSPDGQMLATGQDDKTIKLWNSKTGGLVKELKGHRDKITSLSFTPDGAVLASASEDKTIKLWDINTGLAKQSFTGHKDSVDSVSFSSDGRTLMSGSRDRTVKIWQ